MKKLLNICFWMVDRMNRKTVKHRFYYLVCIGTFTLTTFSSFHAQNLYSTSEILKRNIVEINSNSNLSDYINQNPLYLPAIEKLEFRTETDEWNFGLQEYRLRVEPNSRKEIKLQRSLHHSTVNHYDKREKSNREEHLHTVYQHLIRWYYREKEIVLAEKELLLLIDQCELNTRKSQLKSKIEIEELIKCDFEQDKISRNRLQLENEMLWNKYYLGFNEDQDTAIRLDLTEWISTSLMKEVIETRCRDVKFNSEFVEQESDIELKKIEYEVERAQAQKIIDFVQLRYKNDEDLRIGRELALGVAIQIPTRSSNMLNRNERLVDLEKSKYEKAILENDLQLSLDKLKHLFFTKLSELQLLEERLKDDKYEKLIVDNVSNSEVELSSLLYLKERKLSLSNDILKVEKELCEL